MQCSEISEGRSGILCRESLTASECLPGILFLQGVGPVVAGVVAAITVLVVLVVMYCYCKQNHKLDHLKPSALPSKLRQQFRYEGLVVHLCIIKLSKQCLVTVAVRLSLGKINASCTPPLPFLSCPVSMAVITSWCVSILC